MLISINKSSNQHAPKYITYTLILYENNSVEKIQRLSFKTFSQLVYKWNYFSCN